MSRYTGPRLKVMRALGIDLPGLSRKSIENRPHPPGQHGQRQRRRSDFAVKLAEKQKLRFNYGLTERQIQRLFKEAKGAKMPTGDKLLELLERRLDNFVFRAGFAPTIVAARQLVRHRHVLLNARIASIPSMRIRPGDEITLKDTSFSMPLVIESLGGPALTRPEWLSFDETARKAKVARVPMADEVPFPIDVQQVVEYYANRI
ncbi:MAG: 30S ribosomal protein S4 [Burkholderiales bacterium]|nr:30S ribosomal protein S4 [Burkholderiales bacterium]